ncbi:RNA 3'-terminal phosphate cyclase isoform X1 [Dermacentor albipictus]|uniref:RNA 3'-terminal phosphate cyclase isoform X1 n=1 Tax=Dermacentor albipictus TaxID=60249 RepID=UPI0031FE2D93
MVIFHLLGIHHQERTTKTALVPNYSKADDVSILDYLDVNYANFKYIGACETSTVEDIAWQMSNSNSENLNNGHFTFTHKARSVVLLLQAALPCLLFADAPSVLRLRGGTNAEMAPQIDYTLSVFLPIAKRFGASCDIKVLKRGYYPKGGGLVEVCTQPAGSLKPLVLTEPGYVARVTGRSFVAGGLPIKVAHMMADSAVNILREQLPSSVAVSVEKLKESEANAFGTGSGIVLFAESSTGMKVAGSALGKRGVMAEAVGQAAAEELCQELKQNVCADKHLQDQVIVLMALANGISQILCGPLTLHTETAIYVAHQLTQAKFNSSPQEGGTVLLECVGAGCHIPKLQ